MNVYAIEHYPHSLQVVATSKRQNQLDKTNKKILTINGEILEKELIFN
jgi:hypothetical protein